jgi:hypothetical protein
MVYSQFFLSCLVFLTIAAPISKLLNIEINKSIFISICASSIIILILYQIKIYYFFPILLSISLISLFFKDNRILLLKNYLFISEFIIVTFIFLFFSNERILMDQDELYYWGVKYKYFLGLGTSQSAQFYKPEEYFSNYHPHITSLFHTFNSYLIGFNEGMAIFSNSLILISGFYYLFFFKNQKIIFRIANSIIFYLILNNLSWGFLSIYTDTVIAVTYTILIINLINYLQNKKKTDLLSFILILIFFLNIHRSAIILTLLLIIIILIKEDLLNKKKLYLSLSFIIILVFIFLLIIKLNNIPNLQKSSDYILRLSLKQFYRDIIDFIDIILFSKTYNSQFGVFFNEISNYLNFNFKLLPGYILNVFIWYLFLIYIIFSTGNKQRYLNYSFIIIFLLFSLSIYYDKIIFNKTSPQTFGRYISFVLIPFIFTYFYYYKYNSKIKDITNLFFIIFLLLLITPKKSIGFFTFKNFYKNYDEVNKNYFEIRSEIKELSEKIKKDLSYQKASATIIYGNKHGVTEYHYSLFHSAFQLELFPINSIFISIENFIVPEPNIDRYIKNRDIIVYYNTNLKDVKQTRLVLKGYKIKKNYFFNNK